jgi:hypothetical protein
MFFATIPYRFRYRFVIVLVPSARSHFRSPCKRLRATKHMRLSKLVQSHGAANVYSQLQVSLLRGSLSLHSVLCKFLTPENSPYISNIPDRVLTVPHIMYMYRYYYYIYYKYVYIYIWASLSFFFLLSFSGPATYWQSESASQAKMQCTGLLYYPKWDEPPSNTFRTRKMEGGNSQEWWYVATGP